VAAYLAAHATDKTVVVVAHGFSGGHWPGTGPTLGRYTAALYPEAHHPPFRDDTTCAAPGQALVSDDRVGMVVRYADDCGSYNSASATFRSRYQFVTFRPPALRADSIRIDICDTTCIYSPTTGATQ
jgi:hypothetical protein